ncbi:MAG: biopolymer transporter ExbD [Halofilum sp. (in: g-proteobacteria)]|nr:biopolymer transporter ExbD [Halofilum sp. (in: g-proteobacteria)]
MRIEVPRRRPAGIRLTPLIDVVFILLVFFMLASSFMDWRAFELGLPPADAAPDPASNPIVVQVTADGRLELDGAPVAAEQLAEGVRERLAGDPERVVLVRAAPDAPVGATVRALDRLQAGGIEAASLAGGAP